MRCVFLFTLVFLAALALPNDAYWVKVGGAGYIGKSADVRMISEHVQIKLFPRRVEVRVDFEFKNDGPEQEISMAFPESAHDYKTRDAMGSDRDYPVQISS